jgi:transcriptional regulator EpsA
MHDSVLLSPQGAESMVRVIEASPRVRRRYQFFVWTQNQLQVLVPHDVAICGAYLRTSKEVLYEAFHSVPLPQPVLALLTDSRSPLMRWVAQRWIDSQGDALVVDLVDLPGDPALNGRTLLATSGLVQLLVHGVSRPQRPSEIESLFIFGNLRRPCSPEHQTHLDLLLPHLHSTYLRVQSTERQMGGSLAVAPATRAAAAAAPGGAITVREKQILGWVREGKSNHEIGEVLGISALTVKNHVQKILRKLGAANRAQAVSVAMTLNLFGKAGEESSR